MCMYLCNVYVCICMWYRKMLDCVYWSRVADSSPPPQPETFSLPSPIPQWPQGQGFSTGRINLGEIEVAKITTFQYIWGYNSHDKKKRVTFNKPIGIPDGFFSLGHCCLSNDQPLRGFVVVAREVNLPNLQNNNTYNKDKPPALLKPLDYTLVWCSEYENDGDFYGGGYFWLPQPPDGYKSTGFLVTNKATKPDLDEIRCVRADLTEKCENFRLILDLDLNSKFLVWNTRPFHRGMRANGVYVGTFFCSNWSSEDELMIPCLKNLNPSFSEMPNFDQIHALIKHYGPTIYFHPDEVFFPSSVPWFFENGAGLYKNGESIGEAIDKNGSNLPAGGSNDGVYWIDLPRGDDRREIVKKGNLESAVLYVHVKPALGRTFTDIVMWVFCPFNGPATLKIGFLNISLTKVGRHVGDWEHFTLRICNFTGELWGVYFSQHSGGKWVDASKVEFLNGNKAIVYSSKNGHASFAHPGNYIQGSSKLGIGIRNDAARSNYYVDSSKKYEIISAEYLGEGVVREPSWLQYMREWGPKIVYDSRTELDKVINVLPMMLRFSVANIFNKLPVELYGEEGPTGPKEKNNWFGDERW